MNKKELETLEEELIYAEIIDSNDLEWLRQEYIIQMLGVEVSGK